MEKVKVVLLTRGSSGIGAATAHLLASAGMKVYAGSRRGTIDEPQEGIVPVKLDVNDAAMTEAVVADLVARRPPGRRHLQCRQWHLRSGRRNTGGRSP